jgi:uncharacterized protein (DUF697 family)
VAALSKAEARARSYRAVHRWALIFAAVAWIPMSHFVLLAGDALLAYQLGSLFGIHFTISRAGSTFAVVLAPLVGSLAAHTLMDASCIFIIAKPLVAFLVTEGIGLLLVWYFEHCSQLPD